MGKPLEDLLIDDLNNDESNLISEIHTFFHSVPEALSQHFYCQVCQAHLHRTHLSDFVKNLTLETTRCPECDLPAHRFLYRLH